MFDDVGARFYRARRAIFPAWLHETFFFVTNPRMVGLLKADIQNEPERGRLYVGSETFMPSRSRIQVDRLKFAGLKEKGKANGNITSFLRGGCECAAARDALDQTSTNAFFKDEHLEVMRLFMPADKRIAGHAVDGPVTVQCIEGEVDVIMGNTHKVIRAGDLLYLASGIEHELVAVRNASLLVTIVNLGPSDLSGIATERRIHHDEDVKNGGAVKRL